MLKLQNANTKTRQEKIKTGQKAYHKKQENERDVQEAC